MELIIITVFIAIILFLKLPNVMLLLGFIGNIVLFIFHIKKIFSIDPNSLETKEHHYYEKDMRGVTNVSRAHFVKSVYKSKREITTGYDLLWNQVYIPSLIGYGLLIFGILTDIINIDWTDMDNHRIFFVILIFVFSFILSGLLSALNIKILGIFDNGFMLNMIKMIIITSPFSSLMTTLVYFYFRLTRYTDINLWLFIDRKNYEYGIHNYNNLSKEFSLRILIAFLVINLLLLVYFYVKIRIKYLDKKKFSELKIFYCLNENKFDAGQNESKSVMY